MSNNLSIPVFAGYTAVQCIIIVAAAIAAVDTIRVDCDLCDPSAIVHESPPAAFNCIETLR
jgi:hypothetical protein